MEDRCPYSRRLSQHFHECGAFTPTDFTPLDTQYQPLQQIVTCRNLQVGSLESGAYYPKCALGDAAARRAWVEDVGRERLAQFRSLSLEYRQRVGELMPELWRRKAAVLSAASGHRDTEEPAAELREGVKDLVAAANTWIDDRADRLAQLGLDPGLLKELVLVATDDWAHSPGARLGTRVPDEILQSFPEPVQTFIKAGRQPS